MIPIKERRTKILLLLFLIPDVYFEYVEITPTIQSLFDLSLNQKTKGVISGMIKEGLIEKVQSSKFKVQNYQKVVSKIEGEIVDAEQQNGYREEESSLMTPSTQSNQYRLTNKGYQRLCLEFPFFRFIKGEWDGLWRVISYEIPESKRQIRDRLRREMRGWGLGPWHRSFWLTPHPIITHLKDLVYGREEEKYFQAFESTHVFGDLNLLVEKVWQKSQLDKKYRELFKYWHEVLSSPEKPKEEKMKLILSSYIEILRIDPGLPKILLGKNWIGFEAFSIFKEIKTLLLK